MDSWSNKNLIYGSPSFLKDHEDFGCTLYILKRSSGKPWKTYELGTVAIVIADFI